MADLTDFLTDKFNTEVKQKKHSGRPSGGETDADGSMSRVAAQTASAVAHASNEQVRPVVSEGDATPVRPPLGCAKPERREATPVNRSATEAPVRRDRNALAARQKQRAARPPPSAAKPVSAKRVARKKRRAAPAVDRQNIRAMNTPAEWTPAQLNERGLVYTGMSDKEVLNAYRELRTKLLQASAGANFVCMVSSLSRDASATTVAANLAASIAIDKTKTAVLIDCDLNGPGTDQFMVARATRGVTDYLDNPDLELRQIIYPAGLRRLRVIPLGNRVDHSAEHFASRSMLRFMGSVKARYADRFVIVIAPPIATSAEAKILTELCDLAVLVMPYGKVVESQLQAAASMVPEDKLVGIVCPPEQ